MADLRVYVELTGARTGQTCVLGKYQFVKGRTVVSGEGRNVASAVRFLGRVYAAFPTGSRELAERRKQEAQGNGDAAIDESAAGRPAAEVLGDLQHDGAPHQTAADSPVAAGAPADPAEHSAPGYRHPDTRLREAILSLDKANDELWTAEGRPRLDALTKLPGMAGVTRRDVDRVAPEVVRTQ